MDAGGSGGNAGNHCLVGHGGPGQNRQVGKWHPGAMLELRGEPQRVGRPRAVQGAAHPHSRCDVPGRKTQCGSVLCELVAKFSQKSRIRRLCAQTALKQVEQVEQVGWIHAEFMGQLIALMGLALAPPSVGADVLDLQSGEWKHAMARQRITCRHRCPIGSWNSREAGRHFTASFQTQGADQGPVALPRSSAGGLREIKSYEVLEQVFEWDCKEQFGAYLFRGNHEQRSRKSNPYRWTVTCCPCWLACSFQACSMHK